MAGQPATVGALVQANFTGLLDRRRAGRSGRARPAPAAAGNSCVIVLATDVSLDSRTLRRLASRAFPAMARTGSDFSGRSGDYAIALSTGNRGAPTPAGGAVPVPDDELDLLFTAAMEATEEAILNSLCLAVTTTGYQGHVSEAVPLAAITGR